MNNIKINTNNAKDKSNRLDFNKLASPIQKLRIAKINNKNIQAIAVISENEIMNVNNSIINSFILLDDD
jgi:hypothetical protein